MLLQYCLIVPLLLLFIIFLIPCRMSEGFKEIVFKKKTKSSCGRYHYAENMYNLNNPYETLEQQRTTQINYNTINQSYPHYFNFMNH